MTVLLCMAVNTIMAQNLQGSFEDKFLRFQKGMTYSFSQSANWSDTVWLGDRVYKQMVLWNNGASISNISYEISNLVNGTNIIDASNISLRQESYVAGDAEARSWRRPYPVAGASRAKIYIADALQNSQPAILNTNDTSMLWIKADIPANTVPGNYTGSIKIKSNGNVQKTFTVNFLVANITLPSVNSWSYYLNIWQFPFALNNILSEAAGSRWDFYYYFSDSYFARLRPFYKLLVDMGQKDITAYGYDGAFQQGLTMIKWQLNADRSFSFDFSNFDKYVDSLTSWGFSGNINCFVMDGWKNQFTYPNGQQAVINSIGYYNNLSDINPNWDTRIANNPSAQGFNTRWTNFLTQFRNHLNQKGWFNRTVLCFDETNVDSLNAVYLPLIKTENASWKVSHTGRKVDDATAVKLYNYCLNLSECNTKNNVHPQNAFTFYTSNNDSIPNSFLTPQNNPAEMTWLGWYAQNKQFNGFVRWAYDFWKNTDIDNAQDDASTAGDCELVFRSRNSSNAQPVSSIRLELLRDGIQDHEKMKVLGSGNTSLNNIIASFGDNSGTNALSLVKQGQSMLKKLSVDPNLFTEGKADNIVQLNGSVIGSNGSFDGISTKDRAFDNNINTWVDAAAANGQWVGLDLGSNQNITCIQFIPRWGWEKRMRNGKFQIAGDAAFTNPVTIYTIPDTFSVAYSNTFSIKSINPGGVTARYIRYLSPDGGWCNVTEIYVYKASAGTALSVPGNSLFVSKDNSPGSPDSKADASVYPNPVTGNVVYVKGIKEEIKNVFLTTASGQRIKLDNVTGNRIDVSSVPTGTYFLLVNNQYRFKLIIMH
jgi:hypothetical protein